MFDLQYLAMNTGSDVEMGGDVIKNEKLTANASGEITLSKTAVPFNGQDIKAYAFKANTNEGYKEYDVVGNKITELESDVDYCVRYMYNNTNASRIVVKSNFIPKTLSVILEANLYSGGSCDVETATLAGKLQIKVYRFMLNGSQELSMTATGVSQSAIEGSALSYGCAGCDGEGAYAEIIQVLENETWQSKAAGIMIEDSYQEIAAGAVSIPVNVYAYFDNAMPKKLKKGEFEVSIDPKLNLDYTDGKIVGTAQEGKVIVTATVGNMEAAMTLVFA